MAQLILECIQTPDTQYVDSLSDTNYRFSGFGSTGKSATTEPSDLECNQPRVIPVTLQTNSGTSALVTSSAIINSRASI